MFKYKATEDYENLKEGLASRGFVGMNGIDSMGKCHKNEKHYILRTDGLVIYTNWPWTHEAIRHEEELRKYKKKEQIYYECWGMDEFSFEKLDEVISIVDL